MNEGLPPITQTYLTRYLASPYRGSIGRPRRRRWQQDRVRHIQKQGRVPGARVQRIGRTKGIPPVQRNVLLQFVNVYESYNVIEGGGGQGVRTVKFSDRRGNLKRTLSWTWSNSALDCTQLKYFKVSRVISTWVRWSYFIYAPVVSTHKRWGKKNKKIQAQKNGLFKKRGKGGIHMTVAIT